MALEERWAVPTLQETRESRDGAGEWEGRQGRLRGIVVRVIMFVPSCWRGSGFEVAAAQGFGRRPRGRTCAPRRNAPADRSFVGSLRSMG